MQAGSTGLQSVIPIGWASSPSIKWDGQSRVLRGTSYQDMTSLGSYLLSPYLSAWGPAEVKRGDRAGATDERP
jgi:hypothetical protein